MKKAILAALACLILPLGLAAAEAKAKAKSKPKKAPKAAEAVKKEEPKKEEAKKEEAKAEPTAAPTTAPTSAPTEATTPAPTAEPTPDKAERQEPAKLKAASADTRSNGLAITLAIIPGIAVHGTGHLYAGSYLKGVGLLLVEAGSIWAGMRYYEQFNNDYQRLTNNSGTSAQGLNISGAMTSVGVMSVAAFGFLYSWFDDMAGASIAVDKYNEKAKASMQAKVDVVPYGDGAALALRTRF